MFSKPSPAAATPAAAAIPRNTKIPAPSAIVVCTSVLVVASISLKRPVSRAIPAAAAATTTRFPPTPATATPASLAAAASPASPPVWASTRFSAAMLIAAPVEAIPRAISAAPVSFAGLGRADTAPTAALAACTRGRRPAAITPPMLLRRLSMVPLSCCSSSPIPAMAVRAVSAAPVLLRRSLNILVMAELLWFVTARNLEPASSPNSTLASCT